MWPEPAAPPAVSMPEVSVLLSGASRVLMAARIADAPDQVRIHALVVQAIELAAQVSRTIAAQQNATASQRRAAEATSQAAATASAPARAGGWQFTKTGVEVIETARGARAVVAEPSVDAPRLASPELGVDPTEHGR